MNCGVYDSNIKNTILFYIQVPENTEKESTKLKSVDINLTFIPTYGVEIKRIFTVNKDVIIYKDNKASIRELYEGTSVYIVIEIIENKLYDKFIDLDKDFNFVGKEALSQISAQGLKRKQVGIIINNDPMKGPNTRFWNVLHNETVIGRVTSAVYSPRLKKNIALAMIDINYSDIGTSLIVDNGFDKVQAHVVKKPFYDPNKSLATS